MCVDDDKEIIAIYVTIFPRNGFFLSHTAYDGEVAIQIIEQTDDTDVLILDERMPKMSGIDLAKRVRMIRPNMKIVLVSGRDIPLSDSNLFAEVLTKPASTKELVAAIRKVTKSDSG